MILDFIFWKTDSKWAVFDPAYPLHTTEFRDQTHRLTLNWRRQQRKFPGPWTTIYPNAT